MSAFPLLAERQLLQSRGVRWSATLPPQQCVLTFHTGETPLFEVSSKQNDSFVLFLNYMQVSKTVIIKKCSTPANFLFYYLNGIKSPPCSSIIELSLCDIKEKCSSKRNKVLWRTSCVITPCWTSKKSRQRIIPICFGCYSFGISLRGASFISSSNSDWSSMVDSTL